MNDFTTTNMHIATIQSSIVNRKSEDSLFHFMRGDTLLAMVADGTPHHGILADPNILNQFLEQHELECTSGRYASHITRDVVLKTVIKNSSIPLPLALLNANQQLHDNFRELYGCLHNNTASQFLANSETLPLDLHNIRLILPACCATLIRINTSSQFLEVAHVGDTVLLAKAKDGSVKPLVPDQVQPHEIRRLNRVKTVQDEQNLPSFRDALLTPLIQQDTLRHHLLFNEENEQSDEGATGIGIVNGLPTLKDYIFEESYPLNDIESLLIGSDGFLGAEPWNENEQLKNARLENIFQQIEESGLSGYMAKLRQTEKDDHTFNKYPRFKQHDDATAVFISLATTNSSTFLN